VGMHVCVCVLVVFTDVLCKQCYIVVFFSLFPVCVF